MPRANNVKLNGIIESSMGPAQGKERLHRNPAAGDDRQNSPVCSGPTLHTYTCRAMIRTPVVMETIAANEQEALRLFRTQQAKVLDSGPSEVVVQDAKEGEK